MEAVTTTWRPQWVPSNTARRVLKNRKKAVEQYQAAAHRHSAAPVDNDAGSPRGKPIPREGQSLQFGAFVKEQAAAMAAGLRSG